MVSLVWDWKDQDKAKNGYEAFLVCFLFGSLPKITERRKVHNLELNEKDMTFHAEDRKIHADRKKTQRP